MNAPPSSINVNNSVEILRAVTTVNVIKGFKLEAMVSLVKVSSFSSALY